MPLHPARPPNWRRETLRQASETLFRAVENPEYLAEARDYVGMIAGALQELEAEEAQVSRDPEHLEIFPGMSVGYDFGGRVREFLVVEVCPANDGALWIYGSATMPHLNPPCIRFSKVLWARSSDHRLVFKSPEWKP